MDGAGRARDDRLSDLGNSVLGHILSFLPAKEAARAASLSPRCRDVFANVHTVSLEEQEPPIPDGYGDGNGRGYRYDPSPPFTNAVTAALLARSRHPAPAAAAPPLRVLRVAMNDYRCGDSSVVDQWVSYALKHAGPRLELDLCLRRVPACNCNNRRYPLRFAVDYDPYVELAAESEPISDEEKPLCHQARHRVTDDDDNEDVISTADERTPHPQPWEEPLPPEYTVPRGLFSCAELRSLRIGPCRLCPPATVSLPSLEALSLAHVSDNGEDVQRLISACPRLVDLMLEACDTMTTLSLLGRRRLIRKLSVRCCHQLASIAIDASELRSFEYRGSVPHKCFLTMRGSSRSIISCKVDICGEDEEEDDDERLGEFLQLFVSAEHLHLHLHQLHSARLGSSCSYVARFWSLRHLELTISGDDAMVETVSRILQQTPNLQVLSLVFEAPPLTLRQLYYSCNEWELLDAHHLKYNHYDVLDDIPMIPSCLSNQMKRINLVHYQGGKAQRTLAKLLLCNAPLLDELYCGISRGPLWIQTKLVAEIQGWAMNNPENRIFS